MEGRKGEEGWGRCERGEGGGRGLLMEWAIGEGYTLCHIP